MTGQHFVIVRGRPDDMELTALTVVLAALGRRTAHARRRAAPQPPPSWPRQTEFAFGDSWPRRPAESGSSQFQVHLEDGPREWEHWSFG
jgi:hypothetical protein